MPTIEVRVRRFSVVSSRPFEVIVRRLTATIGRPDMNAFHSAVAAAKTIADLRQVVQGAIGSSNLMEFIRFDTGGILRKEQSGHRLSDLFDKRRELMIAWEVYCLKT